MSTPTIGAKASVETLGTFILVLGGVGTAALAGHVVNAHGVALAFGLTVIAGAYAFGRISGGHFNPAVSVGAAVAGRTSWKDVPTYIVAQVVGAFLAVLAIWSIAKGREGGDGFSREELFAGVSNGFDSVSPEGYTLLAVLVAEVILTAVFVLVILGATASRANAAFAGLTIGLTLTLIHLISIPISNTSVNPARSLAPAVLAGGDPLNQVWLFILAPVAGAIIAGVLYRFITGEED